MNNPFPRAASGSYKSILIEGLNKIGEHKVANEFANGSMRLAIKETITGNVKLFPELKQVCERALSSVEANDVVSYYFWGIANSQFVIASSNVDFIYDQTDKKAVAYAKMMTELSDSEIIQPFFTN